MGENGGGSWKKVRGLRLAGSCYARCKKLIIKRVPMLRWLPEYNMEKCVSDAIAGVTVGLTVIPQGLAYAILAGLEPQYGLYSAFMGAIVYVVFGSCKDITIGPTALMAIMTHEYVQGKSADFAILLAFLSGCLQLLMACLHLDVLIDFVSIPVTVGFTSATSVIIVASQLKGLLGLEISSSGFVDTITKVAQNIGNSSPWDAGMSAACIIILLLLRKMKEMKVCSEAEGARQEPRKYRLIVRKVIWLISTARNAIIVMACSLIAYKMKNAGGNDDGSSPFVLTGSVKFGLPSLRLPPLSTKINDRTIYFGEMLSELGPAIVLVPIIGVLGNVAIAKAFANGKSVDATQELICLGICNVLGSCANSMPVTGSFSRSAVNHASGVATPIGGLYTAAIILIALGLLTPYFYFIPKASLAAVIICAVIYMIEYEIVKLIWKSSKKDLIPMFATFFMCLIIGVEYGILIGVAINIIFLLYPSARPSIHLEKCITNSGRDYLLVTPGNSLYFPAIDFIKQFVDHAANRQGSSQLPVIVDCRYVLGADFTAAKGMAALIDEFNDRKQPLYFYNPRAEVVAVLRGACGEQFQQVATQEELSYLLEPRLTTDADELLLPMEQLAANDNNNPQLFHRIGYVNNCHELRQVTSALLPLARDVHPIF